MANRSVAELVRRCARGREDGEWEELVERFEHCLVLGVKRAFAWAGSTPRAEQLEDLVQETYCKLLERRARVLRRCAGRDELEVGAYLKRVAERVALDHLRWCRAEKRGSGRVESLDSLEERAVARVRCWRRSTPAVAEDRLIAAQRLERFFDRCRRLAGRQQKRNLVILRMAFLYGLSSREISERLGRLISPSGVDTLLHRVRLRLAREGLVVPRRRVTRPTPA